MKRRCKSRLISMCLLLCFFLGRFSIIVIAGEPAVSADNEIMDQRPLGEGDKEAVEYVGVNWKDVIDICGSVFVEMLGAFLGFLSAIALTNRSNKKQMLELDTSLLDELNKIFMELEERLKDGDIGEDYFCYQTPIWEINLESGALALVVNNKVYKKYIKIYSKIQYAQDLETEYVHAKVHEKAKKGRDEEECFVDRYIKTFDTARKREAEEIYENIKKMLSEENGDARRKNNAWNTRQRSRKRIKKNN